MNLWNRSMLESGRKGRWWGWRWWQTYASFFLLSFSLPLSTSFWSFISFFNLLPKSFYFLLINDYLDEWIQMNGASMLEDVIVKGILMLLWAGFMLDWKEKIIKDKSTPTYQYCFLIWILIWKTRRNNDIGLGKSCHFPRKLIVKCR